MWSFLCRRDEPYEPYLPCITEKQGTGWVQPYADSPMDRENVGEHLYLQIIGGAQRYVYLTTPYLTVGDNMISALKQAAKGGVDVRIITPYQPDKRTVQFTSRSYYRELIAAGVHIYEYTDGFIHAKSYVADNEYARFLEAIQRLLANKEAFMEKYRAITGRQQ